MRKRIDLRLELRLQEHEQQKNEYPISGNHHATVLTVMTDDFESVWTVATPDSGHTVH